MRIVETKTRSNRLLRAMFPVSSSLARGTEQQKYSVRELSAALCNMIRTHRSEVEKSQTTLGRLLGRLVARPDPKNIEIDGFRLRQLFHNSATEPPSAIDIRKSYLVDSETLKMMIEKINHSTYDA